MANLQSVDHRIPLEERVKVYSVYMTCVRPALLYAAETWALMERLEGLLAICDDHHRILRYMTIVKSKTAGQEY